MKHLSLLLFAVTLAAAGCHAQPAASAAPGTVVTPELAHRIEVLLRQKAQLPPGSSIGISARTPSPVPGYDQVGVTFTSIEGVSSHPVEFLVSADGKTLAQFTKFDISADPRLLVSSVDRPYRGGPVTAPVIIVGFDDLECPYCARLHATIFPAITERYKDQVRVVYRDFPLDQHPWAMRAAVDTNCLAAQSNAGYWNEVDYIHAHAGDIGTPPSAANGKAPADKTLDLANQQIDKLTREQGTFQKVDAPKLEACIAKQDTAGIEASKKIAQSFGVDSTPSLFINGAKIDGAIPLEFLFKVIDSSLLAEGKTPPPAYVAPAAAVVPGK